MSKTTMTPEVFKQKAINSLQSFDPGLILRGAQLTVVGAYRALQNPHLFRSTHYKRAALAVAAGLLLKLIVDLPIFGVKILLSFSGLFVDLKTQSWDDWIIKGLQFLEKNVLQIPFFLMTLTIRLQRDALDDMFMESLSWVDQTYLQKHQNDNPSTLRPPYHQNLLLYPKHSSSKHPSSSSSQPQSKTSKLAAAIAQKQSHFIKQMLKKGLISLIIYLSSLLPFAGFLVLPAASAWSIHPTVGIGPALAIFLTGLFVPRKHMVIYLQAYHASRSLVRTLLEPYFSRIPFTPAQKKKWYRERQGLLLGFGIGFYAFLRIPMLGILIYGIAEASTAYLITKITDPPPAPGQGGREEIEAYAEVQAEWRNKAEFVTLPLRDLDKKVGRVIDEVKEKKRKA
ncbi:hypothetical protein TWF481_012110 [Arthrobotrys musiformis]|uniref:Transmembrane protein UsgS n=1 Tax=Arthrobotrys musiformis TaxID=47236 RepID=A0AAV9VXM1_9PEZI